MKDTELAHELKMLRNQMQKISSAAVLRVQTQREKGELANAIQMLAFHVERIYERLERLEGKE